MIWKLTRKNIDENQKHTYEVKGLIVRADSGRDARFLANTEHGDEGPIWSDPDQVDCAPIVSNGYPPEILMVDYEG